MPWRQLITVLVSVAAGLAGSGAWALSFGPVRALAYLGQPLDASVVLRLDAGETLSDRCVSATVKAGDVTLPPDQVSASFVHPPGHEARVRVRSWVPIDEPVVVLVVNAGCDMPSSRQFTVFVDPAPTVVALENSAAVPASGAAVAAPAPAAAPRPSRVVAGSAAPPPRTTGRRSAGEVKRAARERPKAVVAVNRSRAPAVTTGPAVPVSPETEAERNQGQRTSTGAVSRGEGVAQLKLDSAVISAPAPGDSALARAAQQKEEALSTAKIAVDVAEAANAAAVKRIAEVESQLALARKEVAEAKAALEQMRVEQMARSAAPDIYTIVLATACGVLLMVAGALFWRLRRRDADRSQGWLKDPSRFSRYSEFDTVAPLTQQFPDFPRTMAPPAPARPPATTPGELVAARATPDGAAASRSAAAEPEATLPEVEPAAHAHDISIEELLDVEQQAEFFVVLGQDDAAIDLLTSHVMASGGASPMPYLKLLEIFRRIGDPNSYERTRKRFNARFNGVAPEWGADPNAGRTLDEYPEVMRRIERAWPEPVDAMTELQTLMFRNDSNLLFELPAYRDIMLLFTVARDLHDSSAHNPLPVDVLLPLGAAGAQADTPPRAPREPASNPAGGVRFVEDVPASAVAKADTARR